MARRPWVVRRSARHGRGVFAVATIPAGTRIIEYTGELIS
ncbi:MAG: SET domain-containing protein-lysine N-methyltransferase, partial [Gemmatimonadota bacterium]